MHEETKCFWSYIISSCLLVVSLIASAVTWSHWAYTINICPGYDCECVLYGKSFSDQFSGGKTVYCQMITFLQIPLFLTASFLSFYQGKRSLALKKGQKRIFNLKPDDDKNPILILKSKNGRVLREGDVLVEEKTFEMEPPSYCECILLTVVSTICVLSLCTLFISLVIGYQWSCNEYRKMLINLLKASGNMAQIISERLECTAIFNFMDYLQPKRKLYDPYDYGRNTKINTGLALLVAQVVFLKNIVIWIYTTYFNIKSLKKRIRINKAPNKLLS